MGKSNIRASSSHSSSRNSSHSSLSAMINPTEPASTHDVVFMYNSSLTGLSSFYNSLSSISARKIGKNNTQPVAVLVIDIAGDMSPLDWNRLRCLCISNTILLIGILHTTEVAQDMDLLRCFGGLDALVLPTDFLGIGLSENTFSPPVGVILNPSSSHYALLATLLKKNYEDVTWHEDIQTTLSSMAQSRVQSWLQNRTDEMRMLVDLLQSHPVVYKVSVADYTPHKMTWTELNGSEEMAARFGNGPLFIEFQTEQAQQAFASKLPPNLFSLLTLENTQHNATNTASQAMDVRWLSRLRLPMQPATDLWPTLQQALNYAFSVSCL